jgi:hypothetical protein
VVKLEEWEGRLSGLCVTAGGGLPLPFVCREERVLLLAASILGLGEGDVRDLRERKEGCVVGREGRAGGRRCVVVLGRGIGVWVVEGE